MLLVRGSAIPLLAGAAGIGGLVLTNGGCTADRSLDPDDFLGVWNAVQQNYTEYGQVQTYEMPVLQIQNYGGMTICGGYFVDFEFRANGTGLMTYGSTDYGSCDPSDIYSYGYEVEWEEIGEGKLGIFVEGDGGFVEGGYVDEGLPTATFTDGGTSSSTGITSGSSEEESGDEPPPSNLPIPQPTRARELLMVCTPSGGRLSCDFQDVDTEGFNIVLARPECGRDSDCAGAGEVCFAQQCVVPRGYDYNGSVGEAQTPRRRSRSFGKLFANKR